MEGFDATKVGDKQMVASVLAMTNRLNDGNVHFMPVHWACATGEE